VIYVIKENRTFDQVFGDIKEARSKPSLCVFPENITPNHHSLARRFGILDNYYCNGVLSADGHSWATEGNVTPYLERAFGGFARSYTFGDDPITYSSSGFLWDHVLDAGLSFRNYGEMDYAKPPAGMKYQEIWAAYEQKKKTEFEQNIGVERIRRYSCRDYPGWNMMIPDVLRMDRFLKEFREFEQNGDLPSLCLIYLPQDHLGGGITTRSHMADNDLALGRLVEAVSSGPYWKDTVIFVNEDDPQNGYDHIDGHRSLCLPISAYSRAGVNHQFYNQTSVLRTILHIFGLPPMNQQDAAAPLMRDCFQAKPNLDPYQSIAANFPLNEAPQPAKKQSAVERKWRAILATVPIERTGMKSEQDEDNLNRFVWHDMRGWETPYPADWSGPHGRGLSKLGLELDPDHDQD
jgi:phospholipase C